MKKYQEFLYKTFQFLVIKFSIYLNRHVFVMLTWIGRLFNIQQTLPSLIASGIK